MMTTKKGRLATEKMARRAGVRASSGGCARRTSIASLTKRMKNRLSALEYVAHSPIALSTTDLHDGYRPGEL